MSGTVEPDISPYGRAIAKNWGGTQAGLVRVYAINKQEGSFFTTEQVKMAVVYQ